MKNKKSLIMAFVLTLCCGVMVLAGCSKSVKPTLTLLDEFKTVYYVGESLDITDGTLEYKNKKGKKEPITITDDMVEGFDSSTVGNKTLIITYENLEITIDYVVKYRPTLSVVSQFKTTYYVGEQLDVTGGEVKYTNEDGVENTFALTANMVEGFDSSSAGNKTLTITYQGVTTSVDYVVKNPASLSVFVPFKTNYIVGETLNVSGGVVCYTDEDGNKQYLTVTSNMISNFNNASSGDKTMTVSYQGLNVSVDYTVADCADIKLDTIYYNTGNASIFTLMKMVKSGDTYDMYINSNFKYSDIPSLEYGFGGSKVAGFTRSVSGGIVKYTLGSGSTAIVITVLGQNSFSYKNGTHTAMTFMEYADYNEYSFYYTYDVNNNEYTYLKVERLEYTSIRVNIYLVDSQQAPSNEMNNLNSYEDSAEFTRYVVDEVLEYTYTTGSVTNILIFSENSVEFYKEVDGNRTLYLTYTLFK